jgi:putative membrane protein
MRKLLILCVDRDDDLGYKAGVKTPVIGFEKNREAAIALALKDPEDSDLNTIFGGLKLYEEMRLRGYDVEIVTIAGDHTRGVSADQKIAKELDEILRIFPAERTIVVTDGADDELVLPIIGSRLKIDAVRRIVVKQAQNLESAYYQIKQLLNDPGVSRVFFIPIGITLLIYAISLLFNKPEGAVILIFAFIGLYFLLRGLGLSDSLNSFYISLKRSFFEGKVTFVTYISAVIVGIIATIQGFVALWYYYTSPTIVGYFNLLMIFLNSSIWWFTAAVLLSIFGKLIDDFIEKKELKGLSLPFFVISASLILWGGSTYMLSLNEIFEIERRVALQYLSLSIVISIFISILGIWLSGQTKKERAESV